MQPYCKHTGHQDTKKDPDICTLRYTQDDLAGDVRLAALEKASVDIYLVFCFRWL